MPELILASASPRRVQLLEQAGLFFKVMPARVHEKTEGLTPVAAVQGLALRKARCVARQVEEGLVLGADTVVVHRDEMLGKPGTPAEARQMLERLSGEPHRVYTGLALVNSADGGELTAFAETRVWMRVLETELIAAYVDTGEPMDKAGAYGIQGKAACFVERIEGCYTNVVGLPLSQLYLLLARVGEKPWARWREKIYERRQADY